MDAPSQSHGVQALIERLRGEGIAAGREEAARIVGQARAEIDALRAAARREADALLDSAREQIRVERDAALGAIGLAFRDSTLRLKEEFLHHFGERLRREVRDELAERPDLLRRLLESVVGGVSPGLTVPGEDELQRLMAGVESRMLADGVELAPVAGGLHIRLHANELELRITDETLTALLLEHLLPRVRRQLDGGPRTPGAGAAGDPSR
jgi:V/A-type H+-transporting ATPase subunit E